VGRYRIPVRTATRLGRAMLHRGDTSLLRDAADIVAAVSPPALLDGAENIPERGPFVAVANHFQRRGLWVGFPSALLTCAVERRRPGAPPLHWAVVAQTRLGDGRFPVPGTAWAYREVARCYEMVALPPRREDVLGRARGLRALARLALPPPRGRGEPIAVYPEGERGNADGMVEALRGVGTFLLVLAAGGVPVLPVGFAEPGGRLEARIGVPFLLTRTAGMTRDEQDSQASGQVMSRIAALVPEALRGPHPLAGDG
jgi:hypothetical protein